MMSDAERVEYQVRCMELLGERERRAGLMRWTARRRQHRRGGVGVSEGGMLRAGSVVPLKEPLEVVDVGEPVLVVPRQVLVPAPDGRRAVEVLSSALGRPVQRAAPVGASVLIELAADQAVTDAVDVLRRNEVRAGANHAVAHSGRSKGGSSPKRVDRAPTPPRTGDTGVSLEPLVVIVDTGIDRAAIGKADQGENREDHWLDGVEVRSADDVDLLDTESADGTDEPDGFLDLGAGHGTFVAGIVRRFLPTARVVVLRALESDGYGAEIAIQQAIANASCLFARTSGPGVLNLSLGLETTDRLEPPALGDVIAALPDDVAVVAAAGNGPTGIPMWPAAFDRVLAVGSLGPDGSPSSWSNHGDWVDFSMVGEGVVSTFVAGEETRGSGADDDPFDPDPDTFQGPDPYAIWSGTSFSTAKVTGRLAAALAQPGTGSVAAAVASLRDEAAAIDGYGVPLEDGDV